MTLTRRPWLHWTRGKSKVERPQERARDETVSTRGLTDFPMIHRGFEDGRNVNPVTPYRNARPRYSRSRRRSAFTRGRGKLPMHLNVHVVGRVPEQDF
jgi:hypothetical protein